MEPYRIFLSSPGDVDVERDRAENVIKKINAERTDARPFEMIRWEHSFYSATADFQAQIPLPAKCHLVICIFWKRLGTDLPEVYAREDGSIPTGTEYEFENALHAASETRDKVPDILVYHKTALVTFTFDNLELERSQYERFRAFWQRWFRNEKGQFVAGFQAFEGPDEFEIMFEQHVREWLHRRETVAKWTKGSPFRGLEPFEVEHTPIFFGRRREIERARARLFACAAAQVPFLLITGGSGSGKSSLVRAGVIPRLKDAGGLGSLASILRYCVVTPSHMANDWVTTIAEALLNETALGPELTAGDFAAKSALISQLRHNDQTSLLPLLSSLDRLSATIAREQKRTVTPKAVLLIVIDQLEELFRWEKSNAEQFLRFIEQAATHQSIRIWIIATLRSDFQHRLSEYPILEKLAGRIDLKGPGEPENTLELQLPTPADLRDMILSPTAAAGLIFESDVSGGRDLARLVESEAKPDAMPAIQYLLSELYVRRKGNVLTLKAFDDLDGIGGVLARRGEEIFQEADVAGETSFPRIVRALVTQARSDLPATLRRVSEIVFDDDPPTRRLIEALKDARLILSDRGEFRFAHDSLLTGWERLRRQIEEERRLFEARDRLEPLCTDLIKATRSNRLLLQGFQLAEGRELLQRWGATSVNDKLPQLSQYITLSDKAERNKRRNKQVIGWSVASIFAALSILLYLQKTAADRAKRSAEASYFAAVAHSELKDRQIISAIESAAKAYQTEPSFATRSTLASALFELSPHYLKTLSLNGQTVDAMAVRGDGTLTIASAAEFTSFSLLDQDKHAADRASTARLDVSRSQDGNPAKVRALYSLDTAGILSVLDDGTLAIIKNGVVTSMLRPSKSITIYPSQHSVVFGAKSSVITAATVDGVVLSIKCPNISSDPANLLACTTSTLSTPHPKVLALSRDQQKLAVADEEGTIFILNEQGKVQGKPLKTGQRITALGFSHQNDWLAFGTENGDLFIVDESSEKRPIIDKRSFTAQPISALDWSPTRQDLVFVCDGIDVCLLKKGPAEGKGSYEAVRHLYGHTKSVTRLNFSAEGQTIISTGLDDSARIWSVEQNAWGHISLFAEGEVRQLALAFSTLSRLLATGGSDGAIRFFDINTHALKRIILPKPVADENQEIEALIWGTSGKLAAFRNTGAISILPSPSDPAVFDITSQITHATNGVFINQDRTLVIPQQEGSVALIDAGSAGHKDAAKLDAPSAREDPWGLAVDSRGRTLYASSLGGHVYSWDLTNFINRAASAPFHYELPEKVDTHGARSLSISKGDRLLATSGGDRYVRVYDLERRAALSALALSEGDEPMSVAFNPGGNKLAVLSAKSKVYIWSVVEGRFERYLDFSVVGGRTDDLRASKVNAWQLVWLSDQEVAIALGQASIELFGVEPEVWRAKLSQLLHKEIF